MKALKVKSILFSLLTMMAVAVFMTSCEQAFELIETSEVEQNYSHTELAKKIPSSKLLKDEGEHFVEKNNNSSSKKARAFCKIDGPTTSGCSGQTITYTYSTDLTISNIVWTVTSGNLTLISGQGTNTATFQIGNSFSGGWVIAYGSGDHSCFAAIQILKCGSGGGNSTCVCPSPVIDDVLCVSGGHPHWRFRVNGINSSDQITWSINHGDVLVGLNSDYAIIRPNNGSIGGFTVFCRVVRTCADGSTKERTAYYTNYYGNSCGTGTTGFTTSCNGGNDPFLP